MTSAAPEMQPGSGHVASPRDFHMASQSADGHTTQAEPRGSLARAVESFFPRREAPWLFPELSVGEELGHVPRSRLHYWRAIGPADKAFRDLLPKLHKALYDEQHFLPRSGFMRIELYMIGKSEAEAVPYVMFCGENASDRKTAVKETKNSRILNEYPGIRVKEWRCAPHIGEQKLRFFIYESGDEFKIYEDIYMPSSITVDALEDIRSSRFKLRFYFENRTVETTASILVDFDELNGHYLVPAHILVAPEKEQGSHAAEDDSDDRWSVFSDDEDAESSEKEAEGAYQTTSEGTSRDHFAVDTIMEDPAPAIEKDKSSSTGITQESSITFEIASFDLDYLLCKVRDVAFNEEFGLDWLKTEQKNWPKISARSIPDMEAIRSRPTPVVVHTARGRIQGDFTGEVTFIHLPYSSSYQEVYVVYFDESILDGDSGSTVFTSWGEPPFGNFLGHVISSSHTRGSALIMPADRVHRDIVRRAEHAGFTGSVGLWAPGDDDGEEDAVSVDEDATENPGGGVQTTQQGDHGTKDESDQESCDPISTPSVFDPGSHAKDSSTRDSHLGARRRVCLNCGFWSRPFQGRCPRCESWSRRIVHARDSTR